MDLQFFTIVALVTALSAAAVTLIVTIRQLSKDLISNWFERAREIKSSVSNSSSKPLRTLASTGNCILWVGYLLWFATYLLPVGAFACYSWNSSGTVLESYYQSSLTATPDFATQTAQANSVNDTWYVSCIDCQMDWLWRIKWLALWSVVIAIFSVPFMFFGMWLMSKVNEALDDRAKITPKKPPQVGTHVTFSTHRQP